MRKTNLESTTIQHVSSKPAEEYLIENNTIRKLLVKEITLDFINHNNNIEACSCRCVSHCSCDCDRCSWHTFDS